MFILSFTCKQCISHDSFLSDILVSLFLSNIISQFFFLVIILLVYISKVTIVNIDTKRMTNDVYEWIL